ncbi:MAG TPA: 30S ribosomal protein S6--L-glutamate ligase, partial [Anaerolineae bacterium]|nr:30S ribosomal protein S6--L-glutamate ligase [Anaerolineae bacterium]
GVFRSNLHLWGTATGGVPSAKMVELALQAANAHGLAVAGVDILEAERGPLVLEVNGSPGLEGIEGASGVGVAEAIIEYLEKASLS